MFRILMVEDEPEEAQRLQALIKRYADQRNENLAVTWHTTSMDMIDDKSTYDLMLLDIDLPGISGMEAAQLVRTYDEVTPIIFVTNLAQYAVNGYEVGAMGFIVKPATYGSLRMNLDRALRQIRQSSRLSITVSTTDGIRVMPVGQIVWIETRGHRVTFHLLDDDSLEIYGSLSQIEKDLADAPILRVAKSFIVNMDKVRRIQGSTLLLTTGHELPISRTRKRDIVNAITDYLGGR